MWSAGALVLGELTWVNATDIRCRIADPSIPTIRLDSGRYTRTAFVDAV